jgi:membrane-bound lytic murein transglycosylase D
MNLLRNNIPTIPILLLVLIFGLIPIEAVAESDTFPAYSFIQPNVEFWKSIYSEYSLNQGVIHDKRNLNVVYGVIELKNPDLPGGRKINRDRIKKAKKKYKLILTKLMRGQAPSGAEERSVAELFGPDTKASDYRMAIRNLRCQVGQKDRFREGVIRSGAYIEEIKQIFRDFDLPEDLAYLPHVESSFNLKAYSKFGAAGVWQFTRSTGRRFMSIGYAVDERRDPIISSRAAAELLKNNFKKLHSWPLAITAYNHGTTGMRRAKRKKGSYEKIFKEYRSRIFKFASRNFYSEFLAAREVAKNYHLYFGDLKLDTPVNSTEVVLDGYASLPEIARHLKIDITAISKLNPALRSPVIRGQKYVPKGFRLRLPADSGRDWKSMLAELSPKLFKNFQKRSRIYTVRRGDTAGQIAKIHGVKLHDLIAANNLDPRATIYINQNLRIPLPDEKPLALAKLEKRNQEEKQYAAAPKSPLAQAQPLKAPTVDMWLAMNSGSESQQDEEMTIADAGLVQAQNPVTESKPSPPLASRRSDAVAEIKAAQPVPSVSVLDDGKKAAPQPIARREADDDIQDWKVTEPLPSASADAGLKSETPEPADKDSNAGGKKEASEISQFQPAPEKIEHERASLPSDLKPQGVGATQKTPSRRPQFSEDQGELEQQPALIAPQSHPEIIQAHLAVERVWNQDRKRLGTIRVEVEETLGHYAEWLGVTAWEIRRLNGFSYGSVIRLDQQIKIPLIRVSKEEFEEKRFEYHQELTEDFFATFRVEKIEVYHIKKGDNIWTLSRDEFEVPLWLIRRYNANLDIHALVPAQKLLIPVIEKIV